MSRLWKETQLPPSVDLCLVPVLYQMKNLKQGLWKIFLLCSLSTGMAISRSCFFEVTLNVEFL